MEFKNKGYNYKGYELGQKVIHEGKECIIIGFSEGLSGLSEIMLGGLPVLRNTLKARESIYATAVLYEWKDAINWKWVEPSEIQIVQELKEDVISIEVTQINDKYSAIEITYQDENVLKRGEFLDKEINVVSQGSPDYSYIANILYIQGTYKDRDKTPFLIKNQYVEDIEQKVKLINEKYGIPKRWRAEKNGVYYYINQNMEVCATMDMYSTPDDDLYKVGNYFKSQEETENKAEEMKKLLGGGN